MKVLCGGLAVCDILIKPVTEMSLQVDTSEAEAIRISGGGDAYNVSVNLAALGAEVRLVTRVGADGLGSMLTDTARKYGVDVRGITALDGVPTSASAVLIRSGGDRSFVSYKGACHTVCTEDFPEELLKDFNILYIGSAFDLPKLDGGGMAEVFARAKKLGLTTVLDTTAEPTKEDMPALSKVLNNVDIFLPSKREAFALSGYNDAAKAADFFHSHGPGIVAVKLGAEGCLISYSGGKKAIPALETEVVDTTGAGDAFVSGFIAAYIRGFSVEACAKIGNAAGAACVRTLGASGALPDFGSLAAAAGL